MKNSVETTEHTVSGTVKRVLFGIRRFFFYSTPMPRSVVWRIVRVVFRLITIILCAGFLAAAFAGKISPVAHGGFWGTLLLSFPFWLLAMIVLLVVDLFIDRRFFLLVFLCMFIGWDGVTDYFPMNIRFRSHAYRHDNRTFTVMSYNISSFLDFSSGKMTKNTTPALRNLLKSNADILCLQETNPLNFNYFKNMDKELLDSLFRRYPYRLFGGECQGILSRYPLERIPMDSVAYKEGGDVIGAWVDIDGTEISVFNIHLMSLGLSKSDKEMYHDLTDLKRENVKEVRSRLLSKISRANIMREKQTRLLVENIRRFATGTSIVCGDFNDVTGCYSMNLLEREGFCDVYSKLGFGPMITYNANRFYFCIDHVMYRGNLRPLDMVKGHTKVSDHYPLTTTFGIIGG